MPERESRRIIVELTPRCTDELTGLIEQSRVEFTSLVEVALAAGWDELTRVLRRFGATRTEPLITRYPLSRQVSERRRIALYNFFAINTSGLVEEGDRPRPGEDDARSGRRDELRGNDARFQLLRALRALDTIIASAEFEPDYISAGESVQAPWQSEQSYLDVIGANAVGAYGRGASLALVDKGWSLEHECFGHLDNRNDPALFNGGAPYDQGHGTSSLSVVLASPLHGKLRGIAYDAGITAAFAVRGQPWESIHEVITEKLLGYGDVLLLEISQSDGLPLEVFPASFVAIRNAVSCGIVVVEPAGNGRHVSGGSQGWDLDMLAPTDARAWQSADGQIPQSGAIMVAACDYDTKSAAWVPRSDSNFGSRVDCYAPGSLVLAASPANEHMLSGYSPSLASYVPTGDSDAYNGRFAQTSAATAIIAGVALVTQGLIRGMWEVTSPVDWVWPLSPQQLRRILREEQMGTEVVMPPGIGTASTATMRRIPDLERIRDHLWQMPLVHVRTDAGETIGSTEPRAFGLDAQSPDIIVLAQAIPAGDNSLTSGNSPPRDIIQPGHTAFVYVRASNFGDGPAPQARIAAYWSFRGAAADSVEWHRMDGAQPATTNLPHNSQLHVMPPLEWAVPVPPSPGTGEIDILIVVGDDTWDPRPELPMLKYDEARTLSRQDLLPFLLANRSVAWRTIQCA